MRARRAASAGRDREAGFTLFEALISVALMGMILVSLSAVTGQWLPNWRRGFGQMQRLESLDVGLQRVVDDLEAAEFVTPNNQSKLPLFIGGVDSVTLVRAAIGPDATPHLELVRLAETRGSRGLELVRSRMPFAPLLPNEPVADQLRFADPVALVHDPFRISFAYAGADRAWRETWSESTLLPTAIRIQARDAGTGQILTFSTATLVHVDVPAECIGQKSIKQCLAGVLSPDAAPTPSPIPTSAVSSPTGQLQ
jgi:general secretion pathway protein J